MSRDNQVLSLAEEIDRLQYCSEELISEIEQSGHSRAAAIAEALREECLIMASAHAVVSGVLKGETAHA